MSRIELIYDTYRDWCGEHTSLDEIIMVLTVDSVGFQVKKNEVELGAFITHEEIEKYDDEKIVEVINGILQYILKEWTNYYFDNNSN